MCARLRPLGFESYLSLTCHRVRNNLDPAALAHLNHLAELRLTAQTVLELVRDRLVGSPPLVRLDLLHRRTDLHGIVACRAKIIATLGRNVCPSPLEELDDSTRRWG